MKGQHNNAIPDNILEPKEGQPGLLCCNKKSGGCPSLSYKVAESPNKDALNQVFDFLFDKASGIIRYDE